MDDFPTTVLDILDSFEVAAYIQLLRLANVWKTCRADSGAVGMGTGLITGVGAALGLWMELKMVAEAWQLH